MHEEVCYGCALASALVTSAYAATTVLTAALKPAGSDMRALRQGSGNHSDDVEYLHRQDSPHVRMLLRGVYVVKRVRSLQWAAS
jgi:hypothetical protein